MEYIDTDGKVKPISKETEKKFREQNKNWIPFEYTIAIISLLSIAYGIYSLC